MTIRISHEHVGLSAAPEDLDATLEWYSSRLGFTVEEQFESHGTTFTFLVNGDVRIEVMTGASRRQPAVRDVFSSMDPARLHHFCLAVDDLDNLGNIIELTEPGTRTTDRRTHAPTSDQTL